MFPADQYQLLDCGGGRKLERFGAILVDRPTPAAESHTPRQAKFWKEAAARFVMTASASGPGRGFWEWPGGVDLSREDRFICHDSLVLDLGWTPFGHVGVFPEQAPNWQWIAEQVKSAESPCRVLNLFGYTGGSTLAAAAMGSQVTHVDSSRSSVAWARRNAAHSGMAEAPIRWIVEDALKYVKREVRRESRYEGLILDPPSYGHGPKGQQWLIDQHLPPLLEVCGQLLSERARFVLLTCHSPNWPAERLRDLLQESLPEHVLAEKTLECSTGPMQLESTSRQSLESGVYVRGQWSS